VRFYSDASYHGVIHWYLYLTESGYHCIVSSGCWYLGGPDWPGEDESEAHEEEAKKGELLFCAPSFEAFMYRLWMENEIWFALSEERSLTKEQQAYANHYKP